MEKTTNYQLNQWEAGDRVQRADFNADNAKIDAAITAAVSQLDAAIAAKVSIITGTYTGTMSASQVIDLGCQPKAVLSMSSSGWTYANGYVWGGLALPGHPVGGAVEIVSNGFKVYYKNGTSINANTNTTYYYIAFV